MYYREDVDYLFEECKRIPLFYEQLLKAIQTLEMSKNTKWRFLDENRKFLQLKRCTFKEIEEEYHLFRISERIPHHNPDYNAHRANEFFFMYEVDDKPYWLCNEIELDYFILKIISKLIWYLEFLFKSVRNYIDEYYLNGKEYTKYCELIKRHYKPMDSTIIEKLSKKTESTISSIDKDLLKDHFDIVADDLTFIGLEEIQNFIENPCAELNNGEKQNKTIEINPIDEVPYLSHLMCIWYDLGVIDYVSSLLDDPSEADIARLIMQLLNIQEKKEQGTILKYVRDLSFDYQNKKGDYLNRKEKVLTKSAKETAKRIIGSHKIKRAKKGLKKG